MSTDQKPAVASSATKEDPAQEQAPAATTKAAPTATTEAPVTPATTDVATKEEEDVHKVFVGNLSFQTKEEGLVSFFETSGKVLEAKIITIRPHYRKRSAGYGFVTFATLEDTIKAAKELNKKELDGREINVEVARPKPIAPKPATTSSTDGTSSEAETVSKQQKRRARKNKNKKSEETVKDETTKEDAVQDDTVKQQPKAVKSKTKSGKKAKEAAVTDEEQTTQSDDTTSVASDASSSRGARRSRQKKNKKAKKATANAERRRVKKELTEPSQTTLFVANIPYSSTDETLKEVFKNFKVASAHVARMRNGRSKGYGFVDLESHAEQLKALETVKDVELEGRTIYLKVALSERPQETAAEENVAVAEEKTKEPVKENGTAAPVKKDEPAAAVKKEEPAAAVKKEEPAAAVKKEEPAAAKKEEPAAAKKD